MIVLQTLLVLYLWMWTLSTNTLARPHPTNPNSLSLPCTGEDPSPSSASHPAPTTSTMSLFAREWSTFKRSRPRRTGRGGIPLEVAILLPIIILFVSITLTSLCARLGSRKSETGGQVWGDSAVDNQHDQRGQGEDQSPPLQEPVQQPGRQQPQDLELSEIVEAPPPPYSREPPK